MTEETNAKIDSNLILSSQVAQGTSVIGDRWAIRIIRDIYLGARRFEEFRSHSAISRGTLASRLKSLVGHGILYKNPYQASPTRYEYRLTDKGLDLYPVLLMAWAWETRWCPGHELPPELRHTKCGNRMRALLRCRHCHEDLDAKDVSFSFNELSGSAKKIPPRYQRRSRSKQELADSSQGKEFTFVDIVGDRWTSMVVAAAFFGLKRFDAIAESLGIATNILADRLKLLVQSEVLRRIPYQQNPPRYEYRLSQKGRELYAYIVTVHEWAEKWLLPNGDTPLVLHHEACGRQFVSEVVCSACEQPLSAAEVRFEA